MKYSWLETIVLAFGSLAVVSAMFVAPGTGPQSAEVAAQLLIIFVLAGALHWGRNGGFVAAVIAAAVYVAMRVPLLNADGFTTDALILIAIRVATYAVIGIVGGEIAGRLKYFLAGLENHSMVDRTTGAYSGCHAARSIESALAAWGRYQTPYSVVILTPSGSPFEGLRPKRYRAMMRQAATSLRGDIRMVDDLTFCGDGRFMVLLPSTEADGATVVAERLRAMTAETLGVDDALVTSEVLTCSRDASRLQGLVRELTPAEHRRTAETGAAGAQKAQEPVA